MIAEIVIGIVLAASVSLAVRQWIAVATQSGSRRASYEARFFAAADRLIEDPDLDDRRLDLLRWLAAAGRSRHAFVVVVRAVDDVEAQMRSGIVGRPIEPTPVMLQWHVMIFDWMMSVSYGRPIMGIWLRAKLARMLDPSVPAPIADRAIEKHAPQAARAFAH